jgi:hypothetical protein
MKTIKVKRSCVVCKNEFYKRIVTSDLGIYDRDIKKSICSKCWPSPKE